MPDNLSPGRRRPPDVGPDELEYELREMFARQSGHPVAGADPAGRALRRARRIQRRRTVIGVATSALAAIAVTGLAMQLPLSQRVPNSSAFAGNPWERGPVASPVVELPPTSGATIRSTAAPLVDLVIGDSLWADRGRFDLSGIGEVQSVRRVGEAWLVVAADRAGGAVLWLVTADAVPQLLLSAVDEVVLAANGRRVAWRSDGRMYVAGIGGDRLDVPDSTEAPMDGRLVRFLGTGVLLTRDGDAGEGYDVWWPQHRSYTPAWAQSVTAVYGLLPDGRTAVGQTVSGSGRCLALLDAQAGLSPLKQLCAPQLATGTTGAVSPNGRWLLVAESDRPQASALLVDLDAAFGGRPVAMELGVPLIGDVAWVTGDTPVFAGRRNELIRVSVAGGPGAHTVERIPVADAPTTGRMIVVGGCFSEAQRAWGTVSSCR
ncbi:MAG TPA: hypothetical protein VF174_13455 [Micromonosporaceae bacterium]